MAEQTTIDASEALAHHAGKYLTFILDGEEYGVEILKVREIIGMREVTPVPRAPSFVKGVINLRGKLIPVTDLRLMLFMPEGEMTDETCIIVVAVIGIEIGIVVDRVRDVSDIAAEQIEEPPVLGSGADTRFMLGMAKMEDRVSVLLDIASVLGESDLVGESAMSMGSL
jgi:purine-binding chemotaxis protein CheW